MTTFTTNKGFTQPANGDNVNTWDVPVNLDWSLIDTAFGGSTLINTTGLSGDQTLAVASYRPLSLLLSGTPTAAITYVIPSGVGGQWVFNNGTSGGFTVGIKSAAGGSTITVAAGFSTLVSCDGSSTGMRVSHNAASGNFSIGGTLAVGGATSIGGTLTLASSTLTIPTLLSVGGSTINLDSSVKTVMINNPGQYAVPPIFLSVNGRIQSLTGGYVFPDSTLQATAAFNGQRLISDQAVVGQTFVDVTGIAPTVSNLSIYFSLAPNTGTGTLFFQLYCNGSLDSGANYYWQSETNTGGVISTDSLTGASSIVISPSPTAAGSLDISGFMTISNIQGTTTALLVNWDASYVSTRSPFGVTGINGEGATKTTGPITGVRFASSAGLLNGRLTVYG